MKSCLALDEDNKIVKFYINERTIDFTNEEFEELTTLYSEMINTRFFGNVFCVYRDKKKEWSDEKILITPIKTKYTNN